MSEHPPPEQIEQYRKKALLPREIVAIDKHVSRCADCRATIYDPQQLPTTFDSLRASLNAETSEPRHLSYEEKKAYVKKKSDALEREMVENHLAVCSQCALEIASLDKLAEMMAEEVAAAYVPKQSFWKRLGAFFAVSGGLSALKVAGLAAIVLVAASVTWVVLTNKSQKMESTDQARANSNLSAPAAPPSVGNALKSSRAVPSIAVVTITGTAGSARSGVVKAVSISRDSASVQFEVELERAIYKSYRGRLVAQNNKTIELGTAKLIGPGRVTFEPLPAEQLSSGDYELRVNGVADDASIKRAGSYSLRIIKE